MADEDLIERIKSLEATQNLLYLLLLQSAPNPERMIKTAKEIIEASGRDERDGLQDLSKSKIRAIINISAEDFLKG